MASAESITSIPMIPYSMWRLPVVLPSLSSAPRTNSYAPQRNIRSATESMNAKSGNSIACSMRPSSERAATMCASAAYAII